MCMEGDIGLPVVKLDCSHAFHKECLKIWLSRQSNCPLCRNPFH
jgi:hypothetical protein